MYTFSFHNGATTSANNLTFNFDDTTDAPWMYDQETKEGRTEMAVFIKDVDGSLTGTPGAVATKKDVYYTAEANCSLRSTWNMQVCDGRYAKVIMKASI